MIKLQRNLDGIDFKSVSMAQILSLHEAFKDSALEEEIWVQYNDNKPCSVIACLSGRLYIASNGENSDELKEFLSHISFREIATDKNTAYSLGYEVISEADVLYKEKSDRAEPFYDIPPLKSLYDGLKAGSDGEILLPSFEGFAGDVSHRLRHRSAVAVANETSAGLIFTYNGGAVINGIAVKESARGKGEGTKTLNELLKYTFGDIYALSKEHAEFYIKNGFKKIDTAAILRRNNERIFYY